MIYFKSPDASQRITSVHIGTRCSAWRPETRNILSSPGKEMQEYEEPRSTPCFRFQTIPQIETSAPMRGCDCAIRSEIQISLPRNERREDREGGPRESLLPDSRYALSRLPSAFGQGGGGRDVSEPCKLHHFHFFSSFSASSRWLLPRWPRRPRRRVPLLLTSPSSPPPLRALSFSLSLPLVCTIPIEPIRREIIDERTAE